MRHVISRLLAQFETFRPDLGKGESRDFVRRDLGQIAQIPRYVHETTKARQHSLTGLVWFETGCATRLSGGGGDRTRVPRRFHGSFYVYSRRFKFCHSSFQRQNLSMTRRELNFTLSVLDMTQDYPKFTTDFWPSSAKCRSRSSLY